MKIRIKMDLALNNIQWLTCHKTQTTSQLKKMRKWLEFPLISPSNKTAVNLISNQHKSSIKKRQLPTLPRVRTPPHEIDIRDKTPKFYLVRLCFQNSRKCEIFLHCHFSQVYSDLLCQYLLLSRLFSYIKSCAYYLY